MLEAYEIPYTFSDPLVCALTLHKGMAKHVARGCGVPTPSVRARDERRPKPRRSRLPLPLFAKPVAEGSSKGVTGEIARHVARRRSSRSAPSCSSEYRQPVLVEEYLSGREFTVGILGTGDDCPGARRRSRSCCSRAPTPASTRIATRRSGRASSSTGCSSRAPLRTEVEDVALATWRCLGCRDAGRVDVRLDGAGRPQMLEVNPLAGLAPGYSDLPNMAEMAGMSYRALIGEIVRCASARIDAA